MEKFNLTAMSGALCLALSAGAFAVTPTEADYNSMKMSISANYKADEAKCEVLAGNTKEICMAAAGGNQNVAKAELEQNYRPSAQHRYDVQIAKANATYAVATEKCDEFSGNSEAVCDKEAKSKMIAAKADADVALKTADANAKAQQKTTDARMDAAADKRDATYGVAKEKCDVLAGDAKDSCIKMAKVNNGQN